MSSSVSTSLEDANFDGETLNAKKVLELRKKSIISCNEVKNPLSPCNSSEKPCLFHIINDPCERNNLADFHPEITASLMQKLEALKKSAMPTRRTGKSDERCDPSNFNGTWNWWIDDSEYKK